MRPTRCNLLYSSVIGLLLCATPLHAQYSSSIARRVQSGTLPATCSSSTSTKDMIWQNGVGLSVCSALNTWTAVGGGGTTVTLQGSTPGTAQTGNINVTGTIIGGAFSGNASSATKLQTARTISGTSFDGTANVILTIPQKSQSTAYTTVLTDGSGHIYHPSADTTARTWTIDSNANVAYPIGTTISFVNDCSAGAVTIAITSDTLILAGTGSTGSRTLAACGIATALKVTSTRWIISGTGLS